MGHVLRRLLTRYLPGTPPFNCVFCPGPAYVGVGSAPITFAGVTSDQIMPGVPVYPVAPLTDYFGVDPNIRTPYVQNWNLNIQQQFSSKTVAQIAYVGSKGTKLFRFRDVNQPSQRAITAADTSACGDGFTFPNCPIPSYGVPRTAYPNFLLCKPGRVDGQTQTTTRCSRACM